MKIEEVALHACREALHHLIAKNHLRFPDDVIEESAKHGSSPSVLNMILDVAKAREAGQ